MRITIIIVCVLSWVLEVYASGTRDLSFLEATDSTEIYKKITLASAARETDLGSALILINEALVEAREFQSDFLLAECYDTKSMCYMASGNWPRAVSLQDSALSIRRANGWAVGIGHSYRHLGAIYINEGQLNERGEFFDLADSSYNRALQYFKKALTEYKKAQDSFYMASAYNNMALAKYCLYNYEQSLIYYHRSLKLYRAGNKEFGVEEVWINMAVLFDVWEKADSAIFYYDKAARIYQSDTNFEGWILMNLNLADLNSEDPEKAISYLLEADSLARITGNKVRRALTQEYLFVLNERLENYKQALEHLKIYKGIKDSMLNLDFKTEELSVRYETTRNKEQIERQKAENLRQELALQKASTQRQRLRWIAVSLTVLLIISIAIFLWRRQVMRQLQLQKETLHRQKLKELEQTKNLETARAMLTGQEQERIRIAEDLHDRLGTTLSAAKMQMEAALPRNGQANKYLDKSKDLIDRAIGDTREISHNLISGVLVKLGLAAALEDLKDGLAMTNKLNIDLQIMSEPALGSNTQLQLFRITQELVNNAVKHSGAKQIVIELDEKKGSAYLSVSDNGSGFELEKVKTGLGLMNVKRRLEAIKGDLKFESNAGGSCFTIEVALNNG